MSKFRCFDRCCDEWRRAAACPLIASTAADRIDPLNAPRKQRRTPMRHLATRGVAFAALATPALAETQQQKFDAPVYTFNGNVFDPPAVDKQQTVAPRTQGHAVHRKQHAQQ